MAQIPLTVIKVGNKDFPPTADDIADIEKRVRAAIEDPHHILVTHFNIEFDEIFVEDGFGDDEDILDLFAEEYEDEMVRQQEAAGDQMTHFKIPLPEDSAPLPEDTTDYGAEPPVLPDPPD